MKKMIDCNQKPLFDGYSVIKHQELGMFEFDSENSLYYQVIPEGIELQRLRWNKSLLKQPGIILANASIALFLINNLDYVPDEMKNENKKGETSYFYFLETFFNGCLSDEYALYVHWDKKESVLDFGMKNADYCAFKNAFVVAIR